MLPLQGSGFADGRRVTSPDSEQIEHTVAKPQMRNSGSVEQIQDRVGEGVVLKVVSSSLMSLRT